MYDFLWLCFTFCIWNCMSSVCWLWHGDINLWIDYGISRLYYFWLGFWMNYSDLYRNKKIYLYKRMKHDIYDWPEKKKKTIIKRRKLCEFVNFCTFVFFDFYLLINVFYFVSKASFFWRIIHHNDIILIKYEMYFRK